MITLMNPKQYPPEYGPRHFDRFLNLYTPVRLDIKFGKHLLEDLSSLFQTVYRSVELKNVDEVRDRLIYVAINYLFFYQLPVSLRNASGNNALQGLGWKMKLGIWLLINPRGLAPFQNYTPGSGDLPIKDAREGKRAIKKIFRRGPVRALSSFLASFSPKLRMALDLSDGVRDFLLQHAECFNGKTGPLDAPACGKGDTSQRLLCKLYGFLKGNGSGGPELSQYANISSHWNEVVKLLKGKSETLPRAYNQGLVHTAGSHLINWNPHQYMNFVTTIVTNTTFDKNMVPYLEDFSRGEPFKAFVGFVFNHVILPPDKEKEPETFHAWEYMKVTVKDRSGNDREVIDISQLNGKPFAEYLISRHKWVQRGTGAFPDVAANQVLAALPDFTPPIPKP